MLRVGRAAAGAGSVEEVLRAILDEACSVAGAPCASIQTADGVAGGQRSMLSSHAANESGVLAVRMMLGGRSVGTLHVYRATAGPWAPHVVERLGYFAQHAATVLHRATLVESQRRQMDALERVVRVLRDQTEEYADQLASLSTLLATGDIEDVRPDVLRLTALPHAHLDAVIDRLHDPIVAGLVLALVEHGRRRHVVVRLHRASHLDCLPPRLVDADAVVIIGNVVVNAVDAVAGLPQARRRVSLRIQQRRDAVRVAVRDWGRGVRAHDHDGIFEKGTSSKVGHQGVGLALVSNAVRGVGGRLNLRSHGQGTTFDVVLPFDAPTR